MSLCVLLDQKIDTWIFCIWLKEIGVRKIGKNQQVRAVQILEIAKILTILLSIGRQLTVQIGGLKYCFFFLSETRAVWKTCLG